MFGNVLRRDSGYSGQGMLKMDLPGRKKRGRPQGRFIDAVKEDVKVLGLREGM